MAEARGLPLLSGPPPHAEAGEACRKCNKEFNVFLSRSRKCNHCGYSYCHNCTDYQALMPRNGQETGYTSMNVCAFCIEYLTITASGKGQLKTVPLSKLKKYIDAYNIRTRRAVEKDDLVEEIMKARGNNGCLPRENEDYYRKHSVPNRAVGTQHRGFFSRNAQTPPAPPPPPRPPAREPSYNFPRPDLEPDVPPTQQQQSYQQGHQNQYHHQYPPHPPPRPQTQPPPPVPPRTQPQPQHHHGFPPQPPRPQYPPGHGHAPPPPPPHSRPYQYTPPRPTSSQASRPPPPQQARMRTTSTAPPPTLDQLLDMPESSIGSLSISALKSILFTNHVNAGLILEKSDLVTKVKGLVDDERRERARQRAIEEEEERERVERQREMLAEHERVMREREEQAKAERERASERERAEREDDDGESIDDMEGVEPAASTSTSSSSPPRPPPPRAKGIERTGLCVICQDDEANIAIVDCGHLAMCRDCSELVMKSSRECPLCRTRIVTEARLLRIFKT